MADGAVGALTEVRTRRGVWRLVSGIAEAGTRREVPVEGRFRAGSVTKTLVATVVLQLVDEGRLRLDDTVKKWLPGTVPDGDRIAVRQLLNHTSGVYDYLDTLPMPPLQEFYDNRWRTWTESELVQRAVANPPTFEPHLNRFFDGLLGGRLLPADLLDEMRTSGVVGGTYGLGLRWRDTTCGVRVYGNDGDALAYRSWSFSTADLSRQVTIAVTPDFSGDPDTAVDDFLDQGFCG